PGRRVFSDAGRMAEGVHGPSKRARGVGNEVRHHLSRPGEHRGRGKEWRVRGRRWAVAGLLAVLMAGFAGGLSAQQQPVRLTLEQAVARGLAEGEEVKAARARRDLAEGQVIQARSGALPQVSAQTGYPRTSRTPCGELPMSPSGGDGEDGSEDRKSTRLNSSHVKISYAVFC